MKRFSAQLKKQAESIHLTVAEKDGLKTRLMTYMEYHPLPVTAVGENRLSGKKKATTEPFLVWQLPFTYVRSFMVFGCLFVVVGVPLLAEQAIPGDILYAMKVGVNEEIRASFASSPYEKIAWETKRLERRITEARLLAKEGRLTEAVENQVIAAVNEHQAATTAEIDTLRTTDAEAAALAELTLVSVLDVQSESLKADDTTAATAGKSTVALALVLDEAQAKVTQESDTTVSYERLVAQLEQETTRGRELLASIEGSITPVERADIERRLADIERKVTQGANLAMSDSTLAILQLKQTWRDMQVVITFMTDIDVRASLALDNLVPVVLTNDEERVLALVAYEEAAAALLKIEETLPTVTDSGINDKVTLTVPKITLLLETASTSLTTDPKLAKNAAEEAREYTRSIMSLASFNQPNTDSALFMTTMTLDATTTMATTTPAVDGAATTTDESTIVE